MGSACEAGELFRAVLDGQGREDAQDGSPTFYDYLEIQPIGNNEFLMREGTVKDEEGLRELQPQNSSRLGEQLDKPVVRHRATCISWSPSDGVLPRHPDGRQGL